MPSEKYKRTASDFQIYWMKYYSHLEYYPDPICCSCSCPCQGKIPVKSFHRSYGIPRYIAGHQRIDRGGETKGKPLLQSDLHKENWRISCHNDVTPGPPWWKYTQDFIILASQIYELKYSCARRHVEKVFKRKGLTKIDLSIFLNFVAGHNTIELAEHFGIPRSKIMTRLRKFEKEFPHSFQTQKSAVITVEYNILETELMDSIVKHRF